MNPVARIPAIVLTGFLGSGKTTLLNRLVRDPRFARTAVLINEFGGVALDHQLVQYSADRMVVLAGGCVCCAMREDIEGALRELFERVEQGLVPAFDRLVIETSGLADPVPLLLTLTTFGIARARLRVPRVVTTVDAVLGSRNLAKFDDSVRQVAAADAVVLTKIDCVQVATTRELRSEVEAVNPWCRIFEVDSTTQVGVDAFISAIDALESETVDRPGIWMPGPSEASRVFREAHLGGERSTVCDARSFSVDFEQPIDWGAFGVWLTLLLHRHGKRILRVKGLINVEGLQGPVAFHAAQHMVHPPEHLENWPTDDRRSRIVFIVLGLQPGPILRSLKAFNGLASRLAGETGVSAVKPAGAGGTVAGRPVRRPTAPSWIRG